MNDTLPPRPRLWIQFRQSSTQHNISLSSFLTDRTLEQIWVWQHQRAACNFTDLCSGPLSWQRWRSEVWLKLGEAAGHGYVGTTWTVLGEFGINGQSLTNVLEQILSLGSRDMMGHTWRMTFNKGLVQDENQRHSCSWCVPTHQVTTASHLLGLDFRPDSHSRLLREHWLLVANQRRLSAWMCHIMILMLYILMRLCRSLPDLKPYISMFDNWPNTEQWE